MKCGLLPWIRKNFSIAWSLYKHILALFTFLSLPVHAEINLEAYLAPFVLETRQIHIQGHPHAFNPSIIKWKKTLFLSFREVQNPLFETNSASESLLYLVELDQNFSPVGKPKQILKKALRAEDGRLIIVDKHLYIIYSNNQNKKLTDGGFRVYVAELVFEKGDFFVIHNECLSDFPGENPSKREKNWIPFSYQNQLLLAYSITPHKIFIPFLDGSNQAKELFNTNPSIPWDWGELRGGTPALPINEDAYLAFFHSSIPITSTHSDSLPSLHYFMGAYLFEKTPPFRITKVSPEPIVGHNFYHGAKYTPYWKPVNVVFPCGFITQKYETIIVYGRQDHEIWLARLDLKKLLKSLIPVATIPKKLQDCKFEEEILSRD